MVETKAFTVKLSKYKLSYIFFSLRNNQLEKFKSAKMKTVSLVGQIFLKLQVDSPLCSNGRMKI